MDPDPEIVEFHIQNKADDETTFFLHFHATDRNHATGLFAEMVDALMALEHQQTTEVLLCCTAGMTTSFFASKLNEVAQTLGLNWSFSAVSVDEVYEKGADKAAVLVAPQIGYEHARITQSLPDVPVLLIPTATFSGDRGKLVEGAHSLAGENKLITQQFSFSRPLNFSPYNPSDVRELVAKVLAMDVAMVDPEVVCPHCQLLLNTDEVVDELARYVPRDQQPKLVRVECYGECILLGTMVLRLNR